MRENVQLLGLFFTGLSLISLCQIIFSLFLAIVFPDTLALVGCHYSTGVGLIAGFMTFPTSIRMKTSHFSPNMNKIYGYTFCFQRLAMVVCGTLNLIATSVAIFTIIRTVEHKSNIENDFIKYMKIYDERISSKIVVDNIQFLLQCCGAMSNKDWFKIKENKFLEETFDDGYSLPFSCCSKYSVQICNLRDPESLTVNDLGCVQILETKSTLLLSIEILLSGACFLLEMAIFLTLKTPTSENDLLKLQSSSSTMKTVFEKSNWGKFSNSTFKSKQTFDENSNVRAQINPSNHSEVKVSFKKSEENQKKMKRKK